MYQDQDSAQAQHLNLPRVSASEAVRGVIFGIIFTFLTLGIYNLYWNAKQMKTFNFLLGRSEFSFLLWLILTILTFGLFHIYYEYCMGRAMMEIQRKFNRPVDDNLALISLMLSIFGFSIVVDAIHQNEINEVYKNLPAEYRI